MRQFRPSLIHTLALLLATEYIETYLNGVYAFVNISPPQYQTEHLNDVSILRATSKSAQGTFNSMNVPATKSRKTSKSSASRYKVPKETTTRSRAKLMASVTTKSNRSKNSVGEKNSMSKKSEIRSLKDAQWDKMIKMFRKHQHEYGIHTLVTASTDTLKYPGLYQWTLSVRRNYRYQVMKCNRLDESIGFDKAKQSHSMKKNAINSWVKQTGKHRPRLSNAKLQELMDCHFPWDRQDINWKNRYNELKNFSFVHKHCNVPFSFSGGLGVWVHNQRKEFKKYTKGGSSASTLSEERIKLLQLLNFSGSRSHEETWNGRYKQLQDFYREFNHSNVPTRRSVNNKYSELGVWCNNQRTSYRMYRAGRKTALTAARIQKLDDLNFQWHYRKSMWYSRLRRLKNYYTTHGHVTISTDDIENQDLRIWLIVQRYHYNNKNSSSFGLDIKGLSGGRTNNSTSSPLTPVRIAAIEEAIPNFSWKAREGPNGPSPEDWAKLFDAMRDKGIQPGVNLKQHWFQGTNPFKSKVKERYTDQELLELWYQEVDDDDSDTSNQLVAKDDSLISYFVEDEGRYDASSSTTPLLRTKKAGWLVGVGNRNKNMDENGSTSNPSNYVEFQHDPTTHMISEQEQGLQRRQTKRSWQRVKDPKAFTPLAIESILSGSAEQILRQRQTYSDLQDDDEDIHDLHPLTL